MRRSGVPLIAASNVQIQGLADRAGLLGTVQNGDLLHGLRQHVQQVLGHERTVQVNLDQANLLASGVQVIDNFFDGLAQRNPWR